MKKLIVIFGIMLLGAAVYGQTISTTSMSILRARAAVDVLSANDASLNTMPYAWLYFTDEETAITVTTEDTWYTVTGGDSVWNNGAVSNMTLQHDTAFATYAGDYAFQLSTTYVMAADDTVWIAVKHQDEVYPLGRTLSIGAELINTSSSGILENVAVGDTIMVQVQNATDDTDVTFLDGMFNLWMIRYD